MKKKGEGKETYPLKRRKPETRKGTRGRKKGKTSSERQRNRGGKEKEIEKRGHTTPHPPPGDPKKKTPHNTRKRTITKNKERGPSGSIPASAES